MYTCMARSEGKRYYSLAIDRNTGIYIQRPSEPTDGIVISGNDTAYGNSTCGAAAWR